MMLLFTDMEQSTFLWERYASKMQYIIDAHDAIILSELKDCGGQFIKHLGDGIFAKFESGDPLQFALNVQRRMSQFNWGEIGAIKIRIVLNSGDVIERNGDCFGTAVNRTARILSIAKGGQNSGN